MGDEFSLNEPLSFKVTGNFGEKEESAITAKMIRKTLFKENNLDISIQQRSTRKCLTIVQGIPDDIDLNKVLKSWKKVFNCNGSIKNDPKNNEEYIALSGDHREEVYQFLIHEGIGTKENLKIHGHEI